MRRPIVMGGNPYITDYYRKNAQELFDQTGGNSGNLAFMFAVANHAVGARFLPFNAPVEEVRRQGDIIILPLANQLGRHTDLGSAADRLMEFNLPVLGLGLGAQADSRDADITLTPGTEKWLRVIASLAPSGAPNIGVRGEYTRAQIARFGLGDSAVVTGCPSNFINTSTDIAQSIAEGFRRKPRHIAVAAGIPFIPALARLERDLADMVTLTGGAYIVQHGLQMLQIARNEFGSMPAEVLETCRSYIAPALSTAEFVTWCRRHAQAFYDVRGWMDHLRRFDFVIGTRFHGAMLALQAGVPAACIAHDSRTQEMCETMGVPVRHYSEIQGGLTLNNLLDHFSFDAEAYTARRRELCARYIGVLDAAEVEIPKKLRSLALGD